MFAPRSSDSSKSKGTAQVTEPASQGSQEPARPGRRNGIHDLHRSVGNLEVARLLQIDAGMNPQDQRAALMAEIEEFRPDLDFYVARQTAIARTNFQTLRDMARAADDRAAGFLLPYESPRNIYSQDVRRVAAMAKEVTRQLRQDLRAGRTSAIIDPADFVNIGSSAEAVALLRVYQGLQEAGVPRDFAGHSPTNAAELLALQTLDIGIMPGADDTAGHAALSRHYAEMSDDAMHRTIERFAETGVVPTGLGIGEVVLHARHIPAQLRGFEQRLKEIQADPQGKGGLPELEEAITKLQQLDEAIADAGKSLYVDLGGLTAGGPPFHDAKVLQEPLAGGGAMTSVEPGSVLLPADRGEVRIVVRDAGFDAPDQGPLAELTPAQKDELVRISDSIQLLRGNLSGLSIKDVPMSPGLRDALGIPESVRPTRRAAEPNPMIPDMFTPPEQRMSMMEKIDRAALVPAEYRGDYMSTLARQLFSESLTKKSETELMAEAENTTLNRAAEALDPMSYLLNRERTDWIGPRAELRTAQAANIAALVSSSTEKAHHGAIYGSHGSSMAALRGVVDPLAFHAEVNTSYQAKLDETRMRTAMMIASVPDLFFLGLASASRMGFSRRLLGKFTRRNSLQQELLDQGWKRTRTPDGIHWTAVGDDWSLRQAGNKYEVIDGTGQIRGDVIDLGEGTQLLRPVKGEPVAPSGSAIVRGWDDGVMSPYPGQPVPEVPLIGTRTASASRTLAIASFPRVLLAPGYLSGQSSLLALPAGKQSYKEELAKIDDILRRLEARKNELAREINLQTIPGKKREDYPVTVNAKRDERDAIKAKIKTLKSRRREIIKNENPDFNKVASRKGFEAEAKWAEDHGMIEMHYTSFPAIDGAGAPVGGVGRVGQLKTLHFSIENPSLDDIKTKGIALIGEATRSLRSRDWTRARNMFNKTFRKTYADKLGFELPESHEDPSISITLTLQVYANKPIAGADEMVAELTGKFKKEMRSSNGRLEIVWAGE